VVEKTQGEIGGVMISTEVTNEDLLFICEDKCKEATNMIRGMVSMGEPISWISNRLNISTMTVYSVRDGHKIINPKMALKIIINAQM
jgi:hypothetical protein